VSPQPSPSQRFSVGRPLWCVKNLLSPYQPLYYILFIPGSSCLLLTAAPLGCCRLIGLLPSANNAAVSSANLRPLSHWLWTTRRCIFKRCLPFIKSLAPAFSSGLQLINLGRRRRVLAFLSLSASSSPVGFWLASRFHHFPPDQIVIFSLFGRFHAQACASIVGFFSASEHWTTPPEIMSGRQRYSAHCSSPSPLMFVRC